MTWDWLRRKTTWAAVAGTLALAGVCYAYVIEAHPALKATFAFLTGLCGLLEALFVADRVSTENAKLLKQVNEVKREILSNAVKEN